MPDEIDIPFSVTGQADLIKTLNDSAKASEKAAAALEKQSQSAQRLTASYQQMTRSQGQMAQGGFGTNSAGPGPIAGPRQPSTKYAAPKQVAISGPNQRKPVLEAELAKAEAKGNTARAADIRLAMERNEKQLRRGQAPPFEKRLETLIRTSRFNAGGVSPLIGRTADLLGLGEGLAGKLGVAGEALGLFTTAVNTAVEAGNKFGALQNQTGSSSQTTGALSNLGIGADAAKAFNERITSDPAAMAFAARAGIQNAPGPYGQQDYGKQLLDYIKYVRTLKDPVERLRAARAGGVDGMALTSLSDNAFNQRIGSDAQQMGAAFNPQFTQQTAEFTNSTERLGESFTKLAAIVVGPTIDGFTKFTNEMTDLFTGRMSWKRFVTGEGEDRYGNAEDPQTKATQGLTKATQDLTGQIGIMQRQYGHGERADQAIPRGMNIGSGYALRQNLHAGAMRLGAFG